MLTEYVFAPTTGVTSFFREHVIPAGQTESAHIVSE